MLNGDYSVPMDRLCGEDFLRLGALIAGDKVQLSSYKIDSKKCVKKRLSELEAATLFAQIKVPHPPRDPLHKSTPDVLARA